VKKLTLTTFCLGILLVGASSQGASQSVIEGVLDSVEKDTLSIDGKKFQLINQHTDESTKLVCGTPTRYFAPEGDELDFGSVSGVGYFNSARITLWRGCIKSVHILEYY